MLNFTKTVREISLIASTLQLNLIVVITISILPLVTFSFAHYSNTQIQKSQKPGETSGRRSYQITDNPCCAVPQHYIIFACEQ
tara:strand:- start:1511 stop:1759 length:249 start_codon:yes stop_codon:yes gene_type:complete